MKMERVRKILKNVKKIKVQKSQIIIASAILIGSLSGCTAFQTNHSTYQHSCFTPARQIITRARIMTVAPTRTDFKLAYGNNPGLAKAYQQYLKTGKAPNIVTKGFEQFAFGASQPVIAASPFELTVITLQPGESVTNVSSGDPLRWSYSMAYSGQGKNRQAHIMVKPSAADLSTDMVITTDKRMYTLKLVSSNGDYLKNVSFWYPDEIQSFWDNYNSQESQKETSPDTIAQLPNINMKDLNFDYSISKSFFHSPSWTPTRIFDDGIHTYIQLPSNISSGDMPALFVENSSGKKELVNYRSKPPYFVVDKIFKKAVLVLGVGGSQESVSVTNNHLN